MGLVLKTDITMLKEIQKIPIWHFPYVLKEEPGWKNFYSSVLKHEMFYLRTQLLFTILRIAECIDILLRYSNFIICLDKSILRNKKKTFQLV